MKHSAKRSVPVNFAMNFLLKLSGTLCAAISYPFAFRMVGSEGMGKVAFSTAIASFMVMLASLGIPTYGIRACARIRENQKQLKDTVYELLMLQGTATLLCELLLFLCVLSVPRLRSEWRLFLIQGGMLLFHGLDTEWLFSALERYGFLAFRSFATKFVSVVLVMAFVHGSEDYLRYCFFLVLPIVFGNVWNVATVVKELGVPEQFQHLQWKRHVQDAMVFFAQAVATTVYTNLDATLLGFLKNDTIVGNYDAAVKVKLVLTFFITSLGGVLLPRFSYYVVEKRERDFYRGLRLSADFVLVTALPLTVYFLILAPECLLALYGTVKPQTLSSFRILLPSIILIGCSNLTGFQLLTPLGREREVMVSVIVGAIVDLAADVALIPVYGEAGAAMGTLFAECVVFIIQRYAIAGCSVRLFPMRNVLRVTFVSLLAAIEILLFRMASFGILLKIIFSSVSFFGTVYILLWFMKEPVIAYILKKLRRKHLE